MASSLCDHLAQLNSTEHSYVIPKDAQSMPRIASLEYRLLNRTGFEVEAMMGNLSNS